MGDTIEGLRLQVPGAELVARIEENVSKLRDKAEEARAKANRIKEAEGVLGSQVPRLGYGGGACCPGGDHATEAEMFEGTAKGLEWVVRFFDKEATYILKPEDMMQLASLHGLSMATLAAGIGRYPY